MKTIGAHAGRFLARFVLPLLGCLCGSLVHAQIVNPLPNLELLAQGEIRAVALQADGKVIVGGNFTRIGNAQRLNIARFNADGTLDAAWAPGASATVTSIAVSGNDVYVGGYFWLIGGINRTNLARISATTGQVDAGWNPNPDGGIEAIVANGTDVYVGGWFNHIGGQARSKLAKISAASAAADPLWADPSIDGSVRSLALSGSNLFVGGFFSSVGGQPRYNLAKVSAATGSAVAGWVVDTNGEVDALVTDGTSIYVGGGFQFVGGLSRNGIAKTSVASGAVDASWDAASNCSVYALALNGSQLYAGGCFNQIGGQNRSMVALLNAATATADPAWLDPSIGGYDVRALALGGSSLYVAGNFLSASSQPRFSLAKISAASGALLAPAYDDVLGTVGILDMARQSDGKILVAGEFIRIGTAPVGGIIRLNSDGTLDSAFNPIASGGIVYSVAVSGTDIYVGGTFTVIGGVNRSGLAKLTSTGAVDPAWDPSANGGVESLVVSGGSLFAGGWFSFIGGQSRVGIAKLSLTSSAADPGWNASCDSSVHRIVANGTDLYVGGFFTQIGGQARSKIARISSSTAVADPGWADPLVSGNADWVYAMALNGADLYIGGTFNSVGGQIHNNIAKLSASTGAPDGSWNALANGDVSALAVGADGNLYAGGYFNSVNGGAFRSAAIARFSLAGGIPDYNWTPAFSLWGVESLFLSSDRILVGSRTLGIDSATRNGLASLLLAPPAGGWLSEFNGNTTVNMPGPVAVGNSATGGVSLKNVGSTALSLTSFSTTGPFTISQNSCLAALSPGASCFLQITFAPSATGPASGTLQVIHDGGNSPFTLNLTDAGTSLGVPTMSAVFSPSSIAFGGTSTLVLTLANPNALPLHGVLFNIFLPNAIPIASTPNAATTCGGSWSGSLANSTFASFSGGVIPASGSCTVSIDVQSSGPGTFTFFPPPFSTAEVFSGVPASTSLNVAAPAGGWLSEFNGNTTLNMPGPVAVGGSAVGGVSLKNVGSSAVSLTSFSTTGPFTIAQNSCPASLSPGASCFLQITFTPGAVGPASGTLQVIHDGGNSPFTLNLADTGTSLGAPTMSAVFSPSSIAFGGTSTLTLTLANPNAQPLHSVLFNIFLPNAIPIASTPNAATTCGGSWNGSLANSTFASFSGGVIPASGSCTVSLDVHSSGSGTFTFFPPPFSTAEVYSGVPASTSLSVAAPAGGWLSEFNGNTTVNMPGPVTVGGSAVGGVSLQNVGSSAVSLTSFSTTGPFTISQNSCPASLSPGASCFLQITFTPSAAGPASGTLQVIHNGGNNPFTLNLASNGTLLAAPTLTASFSPGSIVAGIDTSTLTLTLSNPNATALTNVSLGLTLPSGISTTSAPNPTTTCGGSWSTTIANTRFPGFSGGGVPPSGSCTLTIRVGALSAGNYSFAPGQFSSNEVWSAIASAAPLVVTAPPMGWLSESNGNTTSSPFGQVSVGSYADFGVALKNVGSLSTTLTGFSTTGPFAVQQNFCATTLAPNATCSVLVRFSPAAAGIASGTLQVIHSGGNSPFVQNLSATGTTLVAPTQSALFSPAIIAASVGVSTLTITLSNPNAVALTVNFYPLNLPTGLLTASAPNASTTCGGFWNGPASAQFVSFSNGTIPAGGSCTIGIDVKSSGSAGTFILLLQQYQTQQVFSAPPSPASISLTVTADLAASPSSLAFNTQAFGSAPAPQTVTVTNTSGAAVTIASVSASSTSNASDGFYIVSTTCAGSIPNLGTCTADVAMSTAVTGSMNGSLVISIGSTVLTVPLSGQVTAPLTVGPGHAPLAAPNLVLDDTGGVEAIAKAPDGGYIVGGTLRRIQGAARANIGKVDASGAIVAGFNPGTDGPVHFIAVAASSAFIGGDFTVVGGQPRNYLAKISALDGTVDTSFNAAIPATTQIEGIAVDGTGDVYVAGTFTTIGGATTSQPIVKLSGTTGNLIASWSPAFDIAGFQPRSIAANGSWLYVSAGTSCDDSHFSGRLLRVGLSSGTVDPAWTPTAMAANGGDFAFAFDSSGNVFAGDASGSGGTSGNCAPFSTAVPLLEKLSATDGSVMGGFVPPSGLEGFALASDGSDVYVYAMLPPPISPFGSDCCAASVWKLSGTTGALAWNTLELRNGGTLFADTTLVLVSTNRDGLSFTSPGLLAIEKATGAQVGSFVTQIMRPGSGKRVVVAPDGKIYLGGDFTRVNGVARSRLARFNADGTLDASWSGGVDGSVFSLALSSDALYTGGYFTSAGGVARNGAAKFDLATGALNVSWNPNAKGGPRALLLNGTSVYLAGLFDSIGGSASPGQWFAKVNDSTGALDTGFNPSLNFLSGLGLRALALAGDGTHLLVGGASSPLQVGTNNRNLARLDLTTGAADPGWDFGMGSVRSMWVEPANNLFYLAGSFGNVRGTARPRLARMNLGTGGLSTAFNPRGDLPDTIFTVSHVGPHVYVGGNQIGADGSSRATIARVLAADGSYDASFTPSITSDPNGVGAYSSAVSPDATKIYFAVDTSMVAGLPREGLVAFATDVVVATAPGAPIMGTATAGNAQATVSFSPPGSNGGSPITIYTATSSPAGGTASDTASPLTVTGLANGTSYTFTVTATNAIGTSPPSAASNSVTPSGVPSAPTNVTITVGNGQVTVSFSPPASNGGTPITSYTATCTGSSGTVTASGPTSPITVSGLTNGVVYTCTVTASNTAGVGTASGSVVATPIISTEGDLDHDGKSDLLWRNGSDGSVQGWLMNGLSATQIAGLLPAGGYAITHEADLDGDGKADLLIRNSDGTVIAWLMNGLTVGAQATLLSAGSGWSVIKVGDLNGDGKADLILQHTDGTVIAWLMDGLSVISATTFVGPGSGWSVAHVADLDGDGKSDLVWQNADGSMQAWLMNGTAVTQVASFVPAGTGWSVVLTGDFNGDGKADLFWQHTNGATQLWLMNGLTVSGLASFTPAGTGWTPVLAGDLDGDGKADLFWEHTAGGSQTWLMNGTSVTNLASFVPGGTGWSAAGLADLNGDGKKDVLWKHTNGAVQAWLMNGLTITQIGSLAPAGSYQVVPPQR